MQEVSNSKRNAASRWWGVKYNFNLRNDELKNTFC